MVPEGWQEVSLANIAKIKSGSTPLRSKGNIYFSDSGTPWVKTLDLNNGKIESTSECITDTAIRETSCSIFPKGTVLVAMYGGFNQIGRSGLLNIPATINQAISGLILNESDAEPSYVLNYLNGNVRKWKRFAASSRKDPNITRADVCAFPILLPPLSEQKKIAQILSTWDKAITTTEQLLANSQQQKKALMQQLLTGKKRLLDENGVRFSGEWRRVELNDVLDYRQPTPFLVKNTDYDDNYRIPVLTAGKTFILGYTNEDFGVFKEPLPVIIFDDFTTGSKFVDFKFKAKSSAMKILTAKNGIDIKYVFEAMQLLDFAVGGHQRHWISIYSRLVIPLPSIAEQRKIATVLASKDVEIDALQKKFEALRKEKKALMQQLLTGKRRVKVDEDAA